MTATVRANGSGRTGPVGKLPPVVPKGRLAAPSRRRKPATVAVAVVLAAAVVVFGFLNVALISATSHRHGYLEMAHTVAAGQIITDGDLRVVDLAGGSGLDVLPASQRAAVVGRAATVTLQAQSLVPADAVAAPNGLPPGQTLVAVGMKSGQYPPGLRQGDHVMVIGTGTAAGTQSSAGAAAGSSGVNTDDSAGKTLVADSRVMAVRDAAPGSGSDQVVVSVAVDAQTAPRVAGAASVGKISLVLLAASQ